jgi:4-amino-4-deoxy-L-arabinose transferase-like glycosyltransferase
MAESAAAPQPRANANGRPAGLSLVLEGAFGFRVLAAIVVQWFTRREGALCIFPDTRIYWHLARMIRAGAPFEVVEWGDLPRFALRTPGYPLFLAACQLVFGARVLPVRLVQAALGTWCVWLVARLTAQVIGDEASRRRIGTVPLVAALLAAFEPYFVATAALVLSEAVFIPLMLASLWGLAVLWPGAGASPTRRDGPWALATGLASGAAVLVRPSWAPCVPALLLAWIVLSGRGRRAGACKGALLVGLGAVLVMAPWWVRNARIYGRFIPTALWGGASLYDGLNPRATGASDMDGFMAAPDIWPLDEEAQDAELRRRALAFARAHPGRALGLAAIKLARFWSPWPNTARFRSPMANLAGAAVTVPLYVLLAQGAWDRRRDARALVLLAGPLAYFCALHMVFASSMRYRIPAAIPALGLAAIGARRHFGNSKWGRCQMTDDKG